MNKLTRMNKLMNDLADKPFKYGSNDCYTFTARLVKEWHGKDYTKLHKVYKSEKQAREYMRRYGGLESLTKGTLGYSVHPTHCEDGDVVIAYLPELTLGFVFNDEAYFKTKKTVATMKLKDCEAGWRLS